MATVRITGRPIVAGEVDRTITFEELRLEWSGAGYTLKMEVTDENGTATLYDLTAVAGTGNEEKAQKIGIGGIFPSAGTYILKVIAYSGGSQKLLASDLPIKVDP